MHVPEGWEVKYLKEVFPEIVVGYVGNVNNYYCNKKDGIPFYRTLNIRNSYLRHDSLKYVTKDFHDRNKKSQIKNGDILVARVGANLGMVCKAVGIKGEANIANAIIIKSSESGNSDFFEAVLLSDYGQNQIFNLAVGGAQGVINTKALQLVKVACPPLAEQEKIAEILSTWDQTIEQTERLKTNAEIHKKALMQQLLTGKKRFPEFGGEWQKVKIGSLIKESRVPSIDNSPTNRLTVRLHLKGVEAREVRGTEAVNSTGYYIRRAGQFIYGRQNFHNGAIGIIPEELDFFESSQDIPCFDFKNHCVPFWFFYLCSQESFYKRMEHYTTGTGSKRLHPNEFMKVRIKLPSFEEQQKIASVLNTADREIELLTKKIEHLKSEKRALMQQLLTGKRRVKVDG